MRDSEIRARQSEQTSESLWPSERRLCRTKLVEAIDAKGRPSEPNDTNRSAYDAFILTDSNARISATVADASCLLPHLEEQQPSGIENEAIGHLALAGPNDA